MSSTEPGGVGSRSRERGQRAERTLILFTKNPNPGRVKTRLVGDLSQLAAAQLHAAFVGDMIERLIDGRYELSIAWALGEGEAPALEMVPARAAARVRAVVQQEGDLGNRLFRALLEASERSHSVAAVGSDHPAIYSGQVEAAFEALEAGSDVAIGPAADGGYYLIAVRKTALAPGLFEGIEWSTARVCEQTLQRCTELGLEVHRLPESYDVDTPRDLQRLIAELRADSRLCPRTAALLERWGRL